MIPHPAYPSARQMLADARVEAVLSFEAEKIARYREVIEGAISRIETIDFTLGFPVPGFDRPGVVDVLRALLPVEGAAGSREAAYSLVEDWR